MKTVPEYPFDLPGNHELRFDIQRGDQLIKPVADLGEIIRGMESDRGTLDGLESLKIGLIHDFTLQGQYSLPDCLRVSHLHKSKHQDRGAAFPANDQVARLVIKSGISELVHEEPLLAALCFFHSSGSTNSNIIQTFLSVLRFNLASQVLLGNGLSQLRR